MDLFCEVTKGLPSSLIDLLVNGVARHKSINVRRLDLTETSYASDSLRFRLRVLELILGQQWRNENGMIRHRQVSRCLVREYIGGQHGILTRHSRFRRPGSRAKSWPSTLGSGSPEEPWIDVWQYP